MKLKLKFKEFLKKFNLDKLKIKTPFLEAEFSIKNADQNAAWELYIELLTRVITQPLPEKDGIEKTALDSIYSLFPTTREILKKSGRKCDAFARFAIPVLNQIIRPFTAKWHKRYEEKEFDKKLFRAELKTLQQDLRQYSKALADMAGVEDLTDLESND